MKFKLSKGINANNIFTATLNALHVKYTSAFSNKLFNEHPHKYDMFGLSEMLSDYGIKSAGIRLKKEQKDVRLLETPFIASAGGEFVLVDKITSDNVRYWRNGNETIVLPIEFFNQSWEGVALLTESDEFSTEPNYAHNQKLAFISALQTIFLNGLCGVLSLYLLLYNKLYSNLPIMSVLLSSLLGGYASLLLVKKHIQSQSVWADKICSLIKRGNCNDILESKAAKLWSEVGWSEIGVGYFASNILVIILTPHLFPYVTLINIFTLPYTIWSVWYQKIKVKQWCTLCLIVQVALWSIFISNVATHQFLIPTFSKGDLILIICMYGIPFLILATIIPQIMASRKVEEITHEINSIKSNEHVAITLFKTQPHYKVDKSISKIIWGNPCAEILITILTNPHCEPCARMHTRIEKLLQQSGNRLCIQYIFSSFSEQLNTSSKYLISAYLHHNLEQATVIIQEWFLSGKYSKEKFVKKYDLQIDNQVEKEFELHAAWRNYAHLDRTPTILVNGYQLPANYKIEDLRYFSSLDM